MNNKPDELTQNELDDFNIDEVLEKLSDTQSLERVSDDIQELIDLLEDLESEDS